MKIKKYRHRESGEIVEGKFNKAKSPESNWGFRWSLTTFKIIYSFRRKIYFTNQYEEVKENENN